MGEAIRIVRIQLDVVLREREHFRYSTEALQEIGHMVVDREFVRTAFDGRTVVCECEFDLPEPGRLSVPRGIRLPGDRRALRIQPQGVHSTWEEGILRLELDLPAGSYASVLLEELFPEDLEEVEGDDTGAPTPALSEST